MKEFYLIFSFPKLFHNYKCFEAPKFLMSIHFLVLEVSTVLFGFFTSLETIQFHFCILFFLPKGVTPTN